MATFGLRPPLAAWLDVHGRASPLQFWRFQLVGAVVSGLSLLLTTLAVVAVGPVGGILMAPVVALVVAAVPLAIRRMHDRGRSGWWALVFWPLPLLIVGLATELPQAGLAAVGAYLLSMALTVWGWLEFGFLGARAGAERFGERRAI